MQEELRDQIARTRELAERIDSVTANDVDDGEQPGGNEGIERRIREARDRQRTLTSRYDVLRKRLVMKAGREISDKERAWMAEIRQMGVSVLREGETAEEENIKPTKEPWQRIEEVGLCAYPCG